MFGLRYSPDGKLIVAGDYRGGIVQFWDAASGRQLNQIDSGHDSRTVLDGVPLSPDWSTAYTLFGDRKTSRIERAGKRMFRTETDGGVRAWNVSTGQPSRTYKHDPGRFILGLNLSPNGRTLVTIELSSGESENLQLERSTTLWDTETGRSRSLPERLDFEAAYSPDSRWIAISQFNQGGATTHAIKLLDVADGKEVRSIPVTERFSYARASVFSPDGKYLIGRIRTLPTESDYANARWGSKVWDVATGREVWSLSEPATLRASPNGDVLAVTASSTNANELRLYTVQGWRLFQAINFGAIDRVGAMEFSNDGRWIAVGTQVRPATEKRDPSPEEFPQPRIHLIDVSKGTIRETLIAPPGFTVSMAFSPDGKTLATGGRGKVLLWDLAGLN